MVCVSCSWQYYCFVRNPLLPPAKEVWSKVMFLHLCVILFTGIGVDFPACITGHMTGEGVCIQGGRVYIQWGGLHPMGDLHPMGRSASNGEVCIQWGGLHPMGRSASNGEVGIQWGGLHPMGRSASNGWSAFRVFGKTPRQDHTWMHSC